ncbi:PIN domain-containing protein [Saccharopolyspora flava]|uniref:PIN domain-containing protein n=1 Tax=Saccharopolyspora flava TaxID=95161 RepID=A0A1I6P4C0_9PSEU|nr:PIN domain-containing protein [Saccharopolyspora flava]SFS35025.1 PIN domain-containing protein [Saccharopolyspora flava]
MIRALLDTCVLFKPLVCDAFLSIAEEHAFRPLWSRHILDELRGSLIRAGVVADSVEHRIAQMQTHFPGADVDGYEDLIRGMTNDPKDRHVLAAAVRGNAEAIVTENVRDFPKSSVECYDIAVLNQDEFFLDLYDLDPGAVTRALTRQVSRYRRNPRSVEDLLIALGSAGNGCPGFASLCHAERFGGGG